MSQPDLAGVDWAFRAYETARSHLPNAVFSQDYKVAETLCDIADRFDIFLLDGFGVLNVGTAAIPGAGDCVAQLQADGKRVLLVTNSASKSRQAQMARYAKMGFEFGVDDIISNRDPLMAAIARAPKYKWGLVADPAFGMDGIAHLDALFLGDDPAAYDSVDAFLMLGCTSWGDAQQELLEQSLQRNPRPVFVGNPDISAPQEGGMSRQPGYFAHRLADATAVVPQFFGKPFINIYEHAFAQLDPGFDPARTLMVRDTLHTGILGGHMTGIKTALVCDHGVLAQSDVKAAIAISGIVPDYVIGCLKFVA